MKFFCIFLVLATFVYGDDYYEILDVPKQANDRDIRKAFKKKALELHPDKNPFDKDAQENFIKLTKAYEILKDDDMRKKYDQYGEEGLKSFSPHGNQYHSWSYYHDNFGIYDDDAEIITLNAADFESSVSGSDDMWFINFYHPTCSHCHTLAPIWRKVAQELDGVVRIGAVNCDDAYMLCRRQQIRSYPSLVAYPGAIRYAGEKSKNLLINFILSRLKQFNVHSFTQSNLHSESNRCELKPWLVLNRQQFEDEDHFKMMKIKIGAIFDEFLCLGQVNCDYEKKLCSRLDIGEKSKFFPSKEHLMSGVGFELDNLHPQELAKEVLGHFPDIPIISPSEFKKFLTDVKTSDDVSHRLIIFTEENDGSNFEIRKLPSLLPTFEVYQVRCDYMKKECDYLSIVKTPSFVLFKAGGGYEIHLGRQLAMDVAIFAREASISPMFQTLTPNEFPKCLHEGSLWFVDFFSPWCPPCMRLLPEFRKASRFSSNPIQFGSVDCSVHGNLCRQFNIHQYPTTILYNGSVLQEYHGDHNAHGLLDFIEEVVNSKVIVLTDVSYYERVVNKHPDEIWIVDFYAKWCGHCIQMAREYRLLASRLIHKETVRVAKIDCAVYRQTCRSENVFGYPTIKLFPSGSKNTANGLVFGDNIERIASNFLQWIYPFLPSQSQFPLLDEASFEDLLRSRQSHLVYFYNRNCQECIQFAHELQEACHTLGSIVKCVEMNCDLHQQLCPTVMSKVDLRLVFYQGVIGAAQRQMTGGQAFTAMTKEHIVRIVNQLIHIRDRQTDVDMQTRSIHDEF